MAVLRRLASADKALDCAALADAGVPLRSLL
jgi:hypothetical protein